MKKSVRRLLFILGDILLIIFVFLGIYTVTEYKPAPVENLPYMSWESLSGNHEILQKKFDEKQTISVITWNIGYAALSSDQDFFLDGGTSIQPGNKSIVEKNLEGIVDTIQKNPVDFWLFQEIDEDSKRSFNINQRLYLHEKTGMGSAYAYNFECFYVPFPLPPIGKVEAGIGSYSVYDMQNPQRVSLPVAFSWPVSTANMKRCLLVTRLPFKSSGQELVLINLHLEAYDDGEGREAQTAMLMEIINDEYKKGNYVIAGGDFNQTFPGIDYVQNDEYWAPGLLEYSDLPSPDWQFVADPDVPTARSLHAPLDSGSLDDWQYYIVDGYIVSPNIRVENVEALNLGFKHSDHNPVRLDVILEH